MGTRPVWFIYSGMGSQWAGMGRDLLHLPVFAASIKACADTLRQFGVDLHRLLTDVDDTSIWASTMHSVVCITAVQVALTDLLRLIGVEPDGIVGHSTGEMCCGYADGCLTREQTILLAYYRGRTIDEGKLTGSGDCR